MITYCCNEVCKERRVDDSRGTLRELRSVEDRCRLAPGCSQAIPGCNYICVVGVARWMRIRWSLFARSSSWSREISSHVPEKSLLIRADLGDSIKLLDLVDSV